MFFLKLLSCLTSLYLFHLLQQELQGFLPLKLSLPCNLTWFTNPLSSCPLDLFIWPYSRPNLFSLQSYFLLTLSIGVNRLTIHSGLLFISIYQHLTCFMLYLHILFTICLPHQMYKFHEDEGFVFLFHYYIQST